MPFEIATRGPVPGTQGGQGLVVTLAASDTQRGRDERRCACALEIMRMSKKRLSR
jgi:hypothetical protein